MPLQQLSSRCQGNINVAICPKTQTMLSCVLKKKKKKLFQHLYYNNGNIHLFIIYQVHNFLKTIRLDKALGCDLALLYAVSYLDLQQP